MQEIKILKSHYLIVDINFILPRVTHYDCSIVEFFHLLLMSTASRRREAEPLGEEGGQRHGSELTDRAIEEAEGRTEAD